MGKNFDLTPYIKQHAGILIFRTAACVFMFVLVARLLGYNEEAVGLFRGMVIGALDMLIMFTGVKKAMPYVHNPERGVKLLKRYRYYRLASAGSIFCVMLRMKYPALFAAVGFLLMHIFYILNLSFVACRLKNGRWREERSVKDGT